MDDFAAQAKRRRNEEEAKEARRRREREVAVAAVRRREQEADAAAARRREQEAADAADARAAVALRKRDEDAAAAARRRREEEAEAARRREEDSRTMVQLVNEVRRQHGLGEISLDARLMSAALKHSDFQSRTGQMSHTGEGGSHVGQRVKAEGFAYRRCSENVAWNYVSQDHVFKGWMESPGHRANILDRSVQLMGWARSGKYWTQVFGALM